MVYRLVQSECTGMHFEQEDDYVWIDFGTEGFKIASTAPG
jgi:hypothetical protein